MKNKIVDDTDIIYRVKFKIENKIRIEIRESDLLEIG
jgi:hypothetical protein